MAILIIDDDPDFADTMAATFKMRGFSDVRVADTGQAGLDLARRGPVELAIVDVVLPDMSGHDVSRKLRADPLTTSIPIMQVSGLANSEVERVNALAAGADMFLSLPISGAELVANAEAMLRRRERAVFLEKEAQSILSDVDRLFTLGLGVIEITSNLRAPLSVVTTAMSLLRKRNKSDGVVSMLDRATREMAELLDTLMNGDPQADGPSTGDGQTDVNSVARSTLLLRSSESYIRQRIKLETSLAAGLRPVSVPRHLVSALLGRIVSAAFEGIRDSGGEGGWFRLATSGTDSRVEVLITSSAPLLYTPAPAKEPLALIEAARAVVQGQTASDEALTAAATAAGATLSEPTSGHGVLVTFRPA